MASRTSSITTTGRLGFASNFAVILLSFVLLTLVSWPIVMSFDLWVFKDRSSLLNLDYLVFAKHLRIGIDVCYSYGLLPLLFQHLAFVPFGRGFRPMIFCDFLVLPLFVLFWALLLEHLPPQRIWLLAAVALTPLVYGVNPNWPYALVTLSMLFALLFVLKDRLDVALAISAVGCFCVPSLPLVLTGVLALGIVFKWWHTPGRNLLGLAALFAPGALLSALLAILLGLVFGFASLAATVLPIAGARYYKSSGYGKPAAILDFLHPAGYSTRYYVAYYFGSHVTWFALCSLFLIGLSFFILAPLLRGRSIKPSAMMVFVFTCVLLVFIFFAYGPRGEHAVYESELAAATIVGISTIQRERLRKTVLLSYIVIGMLAESGDIYKTLMTWRITAPHQDTLGLYADAGIAKQWSEVLQTSQHHKTFLLAYATGQHLYYPTFEEADAWFVIPRLLFPAQEGAIVDQIRQADVVVVDMTSPSPVASDSIQTELSTMREIHPDGPFRILQH